MNPQLVFCDTYHLLFHPGCKVIRDAGGLHRFNGPIARKQSENNEDGLKPKINLE